MVAFSKIKLTHKLDFIGFSDSGRIAYYSCKADVPSNQILRLLVMDKIHFNAIKDPKQRKRIIAARVKILKFPHEVNDFEDVKSHGEEIIVNSANSITYKKLFDIKDREGAAMWERQIEAVGKTTVADLFDDGKNGLNFGKTLPFSEKGTEMIVNSVINYGENGTFEDIFVQKDKAGNKFKLLDSYIKWMDAELVSELDEIRPEGAIILGVTHTMVFFAVAGSASHLHLEDANLPSMNYNLVGSASKYWAIMDAMEMVKLNKHLSTKKCPFPIFHKEHIVTTALLDHLGLEYDIVEHPGGYLLVTFAQGAHQVFNSGKGVSVARNWLYSECIYEARKIPRCLCSRHEDFKWIFDFVYKSERYVKFQKILKQRPRLANVEERIIYEQMVKQQIVLQKRNLMPVSNAYMETPSTVSSPLTRKERTPPVTHAQKISNSRGSENGKDFGGFNQPQTPGNLISPQFDQASEHFESSCENNNDTSGTEELFSTNLTAPEIQAINEESSTRQISLKTIAQKKTGVISEVDEQPVTPFPTAEILIETQVALPDIIESPRRKNEEIVISRTSRQPTVTQRKNEEIVTSRTSRQPTVAQRKNEEIVTSRTSMQSSVSETNIFDDEEPLGREQPKQRSARKATKREYSKPIVRENSQKRLPITRKRKYPINTEAPAISTKNQTPQPKKLKVIQVVSKGRVVTGFTPFQEKDLAAVKMEIDKQWLKELYETRKAAKDRSKWPNSNTSSKAHPQNPVLQQNRKNHSKGVIRFRETIDKLTVDPDANRLLSNHQRNYQTIKKLNEVHLLLKIVFKRFPVESVSFEINKNKYDPIQIIHHFIGKEDGAAQQCFWDDCFYELGKRLDRGEPFMDSIIESVQEWHKIFEIEAEERIPADDPYEFHYHSTNYRKPSAKYVAEQRKKNIEPSSN